MIAPGRRDATVVSRMLIGLGVLSFTISFGLALVRGDDRFLADGYTFFLDISRNFLDGDGLCYAPGVGCAFRGPAYPLLLAFFLKINFVYPGVSLLQAALAALMPALAYGIGVRLVSRPAALLAAALTAVSPYALVHNTALQETGIFNFLVAVAVFLLLRAADPGRDWWAVGAGVALAAATLTTMRFALFVPCALGWLAVYSAEKGSAFRVRRVTLMLLPIVVLLGGWMVRNAFTVGSLMLTTEAGGNFWMANNATTFDFLPDKSIDGNFLYTVEHLSPERAALLEAAGEADADRLMARWGLEELKADPVRGAVNMARKVGHGFSAQLSPARAPIVQLGFALVYVPIHLLAAIGLWRARASRGPQVVSYLLLATFSVTTALYWSHTSHVSYLHVLLFIYASAVLAPWVRPLTVIR